MSLFNNTLNEIKKNKKRLEEGKLNCIPFNNFPKLSTKIPGIIQGVNYQITASSGIGKSQLTKSMFVLDPVQWVQNNKDSGLDIKILYFALEESKKEFTYSIISNRLKKEYNIDIDPLSLLSMFQNKELSDDVLSKIESMKDWFEEFYNYVEVIDTIHNPTGIYKYIRNYSVENGTHYYYNFYDDKEKKNTISHSKYDILPNDIKDKWAYSHYTPNNPDQYVVCIVDHFSLLSPEAGAENLHKAMSRMSADYGRKQITKHYNYVFVNVQQQSAESEQNQFTSHGSKIIEKLKPSLANLGDNKLTQRDSFVVFGIFAPERHDISDYKGYNIDRLKDNFRTLIILKNRIGAGNIEVPMFFNGAVTQFQEMPNPLTEQHYKQIEELQKKLK